MNPETTDNPFIRKFGHAVIQVANNVTFHLVQLFRNLMCVFNL